MNRHCSQTPRLTSVEKNCEYAASVNFAFEPFGNVAGPEETIAQCTEGLGCLLYPSLNIVVVGEVVVEKRAEVNEGFSEANGTALVQYEIRGGTVAVLVISCRAVHCLRLAFLS